MGIFVSFSGNEDGVSAAITGEFSPDQENEPDRGVNIDSVASKSLDLVLCRFVADWMGRITSTASAPAFIE